MSSAAETDSQSGSPESDDSFELPDALATGREKRQTAGNRLRDMLNAELESEAIFAEDEEDEDFGSDQDQQADLESELDSSSEEETNNAEAEDAGEQALKRQEKDVARLKKRKAAQALAKPKLAVKEAAPTNGAVSNVLPEVYKQKRIKADKLNLHPKRQSSRAHAVEIAADVEKRMAEEAARKSKSVKIAKIADQTLTQEERLAEAKLTEAVNVASLHKIVQYEEEKRANRKLLAARRKAITPTIRYVSTTKAQGQIKAHGSLVSASSEARNSDMANTEQADDLLSKTVSVSEPRPTLPRCTAELIDSSSHTTTDVADSLAPSCTFISLENFAEIDAQEPIKIADVLFGPRRQALDYPVRPVCPFSGLPARYQDPTTGLYYANVRAFSSLQQVRMGNVPWNPQLRMYVPKQ